MIGPVLTVLMLYDHTGCYDAVTSQYTLALGHLDKLDAIVRIPTLVSQGKLQARGFQASTHEHSSVPFLISSEFLGWRFEHLPYKRLHCSLEDTGPSAPLVRSYIVLHPAA